MQTLKLNYPFKIGGEAITELSYDYANFTTDEFLAAVAEYKPIPDKVINPVNDYAFHLQLGIGVILASNRGKGWTPADFKTLRGSDPWKFAQVGLIFFAVTPDAVQQESSVGLPEPSPSDSMSQS